MRPLLAIVIAVVAFGTVQAYMLFQASLPVPEAVESVIERAQGTFSISLTLTFDAEPDAFALEPVSALVQFKGEDLFRSTERLPAGSPIVIEDVPGVVAGRNEFYVKIAAAESSFDVQRAVRLRVMRDGQVLAERTLWSAPGAPAEGVISVNVPRQSPVVPHEH